MKRPQRNGPKTLATLSPTHPPLWGPPKAPGKRGEAVSSSREEAIPSLLKGLQPSRKTRLSLLDLRFFLSTLFLKGGRREARGPWPALKKSTRAQALPEPQPFLVEMKNFFLQISSMAKNKFFVEKLSNFYI